MKQIKVVLAEIADVLSKLKYEDAVDIHIGDGAPEVWLLLGTVKDLPEGPITWKKRAAAPYSYEVNVVVNGVKYYVLKEDK